MNDSILADVSGNRILVLIPCFNEQGRIGNVITNVKHAITTADIAVVNDCSSDNSAEEAIACGATVLSHCYNLGYGASLETGYLYAMEKGYDIVLQMDGDGQHQADQLSALLAPIVDSSADIVIGSRYKAGAPDGNVTAIRKLGHRIFAGIIFILVRMKLSDPTSGFQALNRKALDLFSSGNFPCDFPDSDVILMAKMSGLNIREVPTRMMPRSGGESMHSGLKPIYYGMKMLLSMFIVLLNFHIWQSWKKDHGAQRP